MPILLSSCTGLLKPGGSATPEKPEGTFYIAIDYQNSLSTYHYLLLGSALERLDQLTKNVAQMVIERVQNA